MQNGQIEVNIVKLRDRYLDSLLNDSEEEELLTFLIKSTAGPLTDEILAAAAGAAPESNKRKRESKENVQTTPNPSWV